MLPILKANCVQCHGAELQIREMNLSTLEGVMKGGESGAVVVPRNPDESLLYKMVHEGKMPKGGKPLSDEQLAIIRAWIAAGAPSSSPAGTAAQGQLTEHDVLPILLLRCVACHGLRRQDGGLDLHTREAMLKGGRSGAAIIAGKPDESLLIKKIRSGEMPPKKTMLTVGVKPVTPAETEKLARWIAQGAPSGNGITHAESAGADPQVSDKDRQFWAFQPPKRPAVPSVRHPERIRNPIDAFILTKLEEKGLSFSAEADPLTLIRRVYFDLTGLPPTPEEAQAILADRDPRAYENLIDRLLASPRYGERWGRHWLDLAGYADSDGGKLSADHPRPFAWLYRDYVIRSFNADKPYDRFLVEQIAGDELEDYERAQVVTQEMMDNLIATGFLRMAPDSTSEREVNFAEDRLDVIADALDVLGSGVMGLTIKCVRCHSHKYDPIPQRDFYRLVAVFQGAYDYNDWLTPNHMGNAGKVFGARYLPYIAPGATPAQLMLEQQQRETRNEALDKEIKLVTSGLEEKAEPIKKKLLEDRLSQVPSTLRDDLRKMLDVPPEKRDAVQRYLAEKFEKLLKITPEELKKADPVYRRAAEEAERRTKLLEAQKVPEPKVQALWDRGEPSPTYILRRGDPANIGPPVEPGVPAVLTDGKAEFEVKPPWPGAKKTGRRLAFARWLTRPDNPLTARVMVNRIWAQHFGAGIVRTLGNFGKTGAPRTHPQLLDWLATEFVRQGWSIKAMHRLMMTSSAYRQTSAVTPSLEKLDPENRLLSRMPLKRMEAELLYDTLLWVSGRLDETRFGVPDPVLVRDDGLATPLETERGWRRAIYVAQRRTEMPTLLESYDMPAMSPNCLERNTSTVAPQALNLMNDRMVYRLARAFAERVQKEAGADPAKQIERAYWLALSRPPGEEEKKVSLEGLNRFTLIQNQSVAAAKQTDSGSNGLQQQARTPLLPEGFGASDWSPTPLGQFCHALVNSAAFLYIN